MASTKRVNRVLKNYSFILGQVWKVAPTFLILLALIAILGAFLPIIPLFLLQQVLDILVSGEESSITAFQTILILLFVTGVVNFLANFSNTVRTYLSNLTVNLVEKHINVKILEKASATSLQYVESREYYAKLDNVRRALGQRWDTLVLAPVNLFAHCLTLISLIGILVGLKWWIAVLLLVGVVPNVVVQIKMREEMNNFFTAQVEENRKISYLERILTDKYYAKELRLFSLSDIMLIKVNMLLDCRNSKQNKIHKKEMKLLGLGGVVSFVTIAICQIYVAWSIFYKHVSVGMWQLYSGALQSVVFNLEVAFSIVANSYEEELLSNVLTEFMNLKTEDDTNKNCIKKPLLGIPQKIEFKDVSYKYQDATEYTIRNLNLTINQGECLALVGLNGAGKSTLVRLICGLYYPTEGEILFDGEDIRNFSREDIFNLFGVVFQDFAQYAFTISENVTISDMKADKDDDAIINAIHSAGAEKMVSNLPNQYMTYISKEYDKWGVGNLSGGEWQKIAIARCFYKDAPFVILDEPTSNLDPLSEYEVFENFSKLMSHKTSIII